MKQIVKIAARMLMIGVSFFAVANLTAAPLVSSALTADNTLQKRTFAIKNMTCATCPITVHKAMSKVTGVQSVDVNFDAKTATVEFDPATTTIDEIALSATNAGYPAALSGES